MCCGALQHEVGAIPAHTRAICPKLCAWGGCVYRNDIVFLLDLLLHSVLPF